MKVVNCRGDCRLGNAGKLLPPSLPFDGTFATETGEFPKLNEDDCTTLDPAVLPEFLSRHRVVIVVGVIGFIVSCLGMAHETDTRPFNFVPSSLSRLFPAAMSIAGSQVAPGLGELPKINWLRECGVVSGLTAGMFVNDRLAV